MNLEVLEILVNIMIIGAILIFAIIGLKANFLTSIVYMGVDIVLSIVRKLFYRDMNDAQTQDTDKIIRKFKRLRTVQTDTRDESIKIYKSIDELRKNSNVENQKLIKILDTNFDKMNNSLEIAIDKLSEGATEEIIKALEQVINLLEWQHNYKTYIEHIEEHLTISTSSIEKSKDSLEIISSKNDDVLKVYQELKHIIDIYDRQINELNQHLKTYSKLTDNTKDMFVTITENISQINEDFTTLSEVIKNSNSQRKDSFIENTQDIKKSHIDLTEHIKNDNRVSDNFNDIFIKLDEIKNNLSSKYSNLDRKLGDIDNNFQTIHKILKDNASEQIKNQESYHIKYKKIFFIGFSSLITIPITIYINISISNISSQIINNTQTISKIDKSTQDNQYIDYTLNQIKKQNSNNAQTIKDIKESIKLQNEILRKIAQNTQSSNR